MKSSFAYYFTISINWTVDCRTIAINHKGSLMEIDTSNGHAEMDYAEHQRTYKGFIKATIICTAGIIALLVAMAIFLL